jgi:hypothetical protein
MKKKPIAEPIISPEILELAKRSVEQEIPQKKRSCGVCGSDCSPLTGPQMDDDTLCWVCRRLKISAWRESEQQMSAQE